MVGLTNSDGCRPPIVQIDNRPGQFDSRFSGTFGRRLAIRAAKVDPQKLKNKLQRHQSGVWLASTGEFARWWFIPGPEPSTSVIAFRLLESETLWFLVRF